MHRVCDQTLGAKHTTKTTAGTTVNINHGRETEGGTDRGRHTVGKRCEKSDSEGVRDSEGESESRTEKWSRERERGKQSKIDGGDGGGGGGGGKRDRQTDR